MPFKDCSIWIHVVFSTKKRIPYLSWEIRNEICYWLKVHSINKGIHIDIANGKKDHLHILVRLKSNQTVSEIVKWIKGASSHYLNKEYSWSPKFEWQKGYGAHSVSNNDIKQIRQYIYNQEKHHS